MTNKVIIRVQFDSDPKPPNITMLPKPEKFIATVKVVSRYVIGQDGKALKIA